VTRFGPAGHSQSFYEQGKKTSVQAPEWLSRMGLSAFEYQCGRGVKISDELAAAMAGEARRWGVAVSLHAPYYISLSGAEDKRLRSVDYILQSARAVAAMGGDRIVVHPGGSQKLSRIQALEMARGTLREAWQALDDQGLGQVHLCMETMGRPGQLGTLEEILSLCELDERMLPCVDFGHLHTRSFGGLKTYEDYARIFHSMENKLGADRTRRFHAHFSKIEYSVPGGERRHLTFADDVYGPDFEPVAELTVRMGCSPVFICESSGTQAEDAAKMKDIYERVLRSGESGSELAEKPI
jgi:deoxyribonuclease-4